MTDIPGREEIEQYVKVLQHFLAGGEVQRWLGGEAWGKTLSPQQVPPQEVRIKPEPRGVWCALDLDGSAFAHNCFNRKVTAEHYAREHKGKSANGQVIWLGEGNGNDQS